MHFYAEVSPTEFSGVYSQESVSRIAAANYFNNRVKYAFKSASLCLDHAIPQKISS